MNSTAEQIKERITCIDYARRVGLDVMNEGDRTVSFISPGSNKSACVYYKDFFYDFKEGAGGDVIDLCAMYAHNGDRGAAFRDLEDACGIRGEDRSAWVSYQNNLNNNIAYWHKNLRPEDFDYLHGRRITDETAERLKLGFNGSRLVIPYFKNGYSPYYITRSLSKNDTVKYKKAKTDRMNEHIPWGMHTLDRGNPTLVIAEGTFDAMSFEQEGYSVLSPMCGRFNKEQMKQTLSAAHSFDQVFVIFDTDDSGKSFTLNCAKELHYARIPFTVGRVPAPNKDVSDFYTAGGDLTELVMNAIDGPVYLASMCNSEKELKAFVMKTARFTDNASLNKMKTGVTALNQFDPAFISGLFKMAEKAPPESMVATEIIKKHRIIYNEAIGFYEYKNGFWNYLNDTQMKGMIGKQLGRFEKSSLMKSVMDVIKGRIVTTELMNAKPVHNMKNGTFEVNTGVFREHRASDLCTTQVDYDYNETAKCEKWIGFIDEITDFDEKRKLKLQEISGYFFLEDNRLQKCFYLLGQGGNGKSVLMDVWALMVGEENVSNVSMSSLTEPFQRIKLLTSMVNISSETKTNVNGAESEFKQIVVGDSTSGCFKGKDFISFRPRAKWVLSANDFFKPKDDTDGFLRRICFIKFPIKFVTDRAPENPNERIGDLMIKQKLEEELPGIFNWAYEGYKRLVLNMRFTETDEEREIMQEFVETINPVFLFYQEWRPDLMNGKIMNSEIYDAYESWATENGIVKRQTRMTVSREYAKFFRKDHAGWESFKSGASRGIRDVNFKPTQINFVGR